MPTFCAKNPITPPPTSKPKSFLTAHVEETADVLNVRADQADTADGVRPDRAAVSADRNADDHVAGQRRDVAVVRELEVRCSPVLVSKKFGE